MDKHPQLKLITALLILSVSGLSAQRSETVKVEHVEATMIGEYEHLQPGTPYHLGLLIKHDPHWHTYWKSTATGYATSIDWDLPEGFQVSEILWPTPVTYDFQGLIEYVYEDEVLLMVTLIPPEALDEDYLEIGFSAEWLMCEKLCIPGEFKSSIRIPVSSEEAKPSAVWAPYFEEARAQLPVDSDAYQFQAFKRGPDEISIRISGPEPIPEKLVFFDAQAIFRPQSTAHTRRLDAKTVEILLQKAPEAEATPSRVTGVIAAEGGWPGAGEALSLVVDSPVNSAPPATSQAENSLSVGLLVLAFLGGLVLNLMPCVFPVIGIKIMGFVGQAGESRAKVVSHGLIFTLGVLISFWTLTAILLVLRSGGNQLGWGFQLQSPTFVLLLGLFLFAFALNMSGLFEVGQSAVGLGSDLTGRKGIAGSFFSGILATVVATPCAAPFLAPALGAALTIPPAQSFLVFTFIALGLALPYLLLSAFPGLVNHLPKPGPWMETFKQMMAFLLYGTAAYLVWVLAGQLSDENAFPPFSLLKALFSFVILALALWAFGRWGAYHRKKSTRAAGILVSVLMLCGAVLLGWSGTHARTSGPSTIEWQKWEPGKAEELSRQGHTVYVDFTARWCVTCQTNKATVFSSRKVLDALEEKEVILLKADWTNRDPDISNALQSFNRSAVPFNLVYGPGLSSPIILPEILTPGKVLEALNQASSPLRE